MCFCSVIQASPSAQQSVILALFRIRLLFKKKDKISIVRALVGFIMDTGGRPFFSFLHIKALKVPMLSSPETTLQDMISKESCGICYRY